MSPAQRAIRPLAWLLAALLVPPLGAAMPARARDTAAVASERPYGWQCLARDAGEIARAPLQDGPHGRRRLFAILGVAAGLFVGREEIREAVQRNRDDDRSEWLQDARTMGKGAVAPALALGLWASALGTGRDRERESAFMLLESAGFSAVAALAGSYVLASERPEEGERVRWFDRRGHGVSLDAALSASVVPPLRCRYLRVRPEDGRARRVWKRVGTGLLYGGAVLTAYQRMDDDKHWAPDAFLGAATGFGIGGAVCRAHDESSRVAAAPRGVRVLPGTGGLRITWGHVAPDERVISP